MDSDEESEDNREFFEVMQRYHAAVEQGRMEDADAATLELFEAAGNLVLKDPRPEWAFREEARGFEAEGKWQFAELAYRKALEITDAAGDAVWQFRAHSDLSRHYHLVGRLDAAAQHAKLSTEHARQTDIPISLAGTLEWESFVGLELNRVTDALAAIQEALGIIESEYSDEPISRGRGLVLRADCFRRSGDLVSAAADLENAMSGLKSLEALEFAAGVHSTIGSWWLVKARLLIEMNECPAGLQAWQKAIASKRHVAGLPQCEGPHVKSILASALWEYGNALLTAGRGEKHSAGGFCGVIDSDLLAEGVRGTVTA
jgi:tetratricopeptide (TPR) repeat protein